MEKTTPFVSRPMRKQGRNEGVAQNVLGDRLQARLLQSDLEVVLVRGS